MKIAVVSDIHQTSYWKYTIGQINDFDKVIFLGDEFDCWDNVWPLQMDNALEIIQFKKQYPDKVDLCWSNHAISYFLDERCSGYQYHNSLDIKEFYRLNKSLYNVVYIYDNWIFSHGGVSLRWMQCCALNDVNEINQLFRERPNYFRWVGPDGYGNNPNEGPLWIRPKALIKNSVQGFNQVAGHTENSEPLIEKKNNQTFVFCDTPDHNYLTILDTKSGSVDFVDIW